MTSPRVTESPLLLDGWLEYNHQRWGLRPIRQTYGTSTGHLPSIETVLYVDAKGRVLHSPRNPYLPVVFRSTLTSSQVRLQRQWLEVAEPFAADLERRGLAQAVALPPEVFDLRPWQWRRFRVSTRYTFYLEFPYTTADADSSVRKNSRKAVDAGYTVNREADMRAVHTCLLATESRQGFSHDISIRELQLVRDLLGEDNFRAYVARANDGTPVSARIVLHVPGARAIDWVAGTDSRHLQSGVTQHLIGHVLNDLQQAGASGFDFAGANIARVAAAKACWGGKLTAYHILESPNLRFLARVMRDMSLRLMRTGKLK